MLVGTVPGLIFTPLQAETLGSPSISHAAGTGKKNNPGCRCKRGEIDPKAAEIGIKIFLSAREFLVASWKTSPFIHEMRVSARTSFSSTCARVTSNCSSLPKRDSAYVYKYVCAPESLYTCALICMYSCLNSSYLYIFMS